MTDIKFTFIELRKFNKRIDALSTLTEKWVFFIKNAENLDVIPDNIDDEGLIEAYKDADKHSWKKEELIAYDNASIAEQDERGRLIAAENRGKTAGKMEVKERVVVRGQRKGMKVEDIAEIAGLTVEEVN